jgi:hypothetical protein
MQLDDYDALLDALEAKIIDACTCHDYTEVARLGREAEALCAEGDSRRRSEVMLARGRRQLDDVSTVDDLIERWRDAE